MSDYFLNKIYDSLLVNKAPKTKSTFRTLSESYNLVYEEESDETQTPQTQTEQPNQTTQPSLQFNIETYQTNNWTPFQQNLYSKKITGTGPGEFSVASLITGIEDPNREEELQNYITGGSASFDVSFPANVPNPKYKFEVKDIKKGSVPIAKHGTKVYQQFTAQVKEIVTEILETFNTLDEGSKQAVNDYLISQISEEPAPNIFVQRAGIIPTESELEKLLSRQPTEEEKGRRITTSQDTLSQFKKWQLHQRQKQSWSLDQWGKGILGNIREIPFTIIFASPAGKILDVRREVEELEQGEEFVPELQKSRLLFSIEDIINIIDQFEQTEAERQAPEDQTKRIQTLSQTFKQFYGTGNSEELNQKLDQEALRTDKALTTLKYKITGTGSKDLTTFIREFQGLQLKNKINNVKQFLSSSEAILSLFPSSITGLFIVSPQGYHYIPRQELPNKIKIDTITRMTPKIKLK
jgi:hypothetical protein